MLPVAPQSPGRMALATLFLVAGLAHAERSPGVQFTSQVAATGVAVEARTVIDAPAEQVAQLAGDPAAFGELFPAEEVRVVGTKGDARRVAIAMRHPWPTGLVRWVETVSLRRDPDGRSLLVERDLESGSYYDRMRATWRVTPLAPSPEAGARCEVVYRVAITLAGWAPAWILRRGVISGMKFTVERLRAMSLQRLPRDAAPRRPSSTGN
ncbi:MAG: hypothetical protein EXR72_25625 [Myxococcales bacterium]|nr:hypothetical protein [Myxococcales bacterium]